MSKSLPLKEMTLHEKLAAMELLLEDLAGCPESVDSAARTKTFSMSDQRVTKAKANLPIGNRQN